MATITPKTFPGVYTTIVDKSFFTPVSSNFKPGLIGVATKGPFDTPIVVTSLKDFVNQFGRPLTTTYTTDPATDITIPDGGGFFLADAVDAMSDFVNNVTVVRIGNRYTALEPADGYTSGAFTYTLYSPFNAPRIQALKATGDVFLRVSQPGLPTTVNVSVVSAGGGTIAIDTAGDSLQAAYGPDAQIDYSIYDKAANSAEGVLYAYTYGTSAGQLTDAVYTSVGSISGYKNQFQMYCSANASAIQVGDVFKVKETGKDPTHEIRVKSTLINYADTSGTIFLEKTDITQIGYQALPLQDNYASAALYKPTGKVIFLSLKAANEGTWANGADSSQGLYLKVRPGSNDGTKKLEVYWDSALVETHDGITDDPTDTTNFWAYRLEKGKSAYVYVADSGVSNPFGQNWTCANTVAPWDARFFGSNATPGLPVPMPLGATNAGWLAITVGNVQDTGGQFTQGYNGENPTDSDWIGDLDPTTDMMSGVRAFEDTDTVDVNIIAAPMDNISIAVMEQMGRTCAKINAEAVCDVPAGLNAREAIDWHNGKLPTQDGTRLDNRNVAIYWNWFVRTNRFGETKWVPPTIGLLQNMAKVFNTYAPWYAVAGEIRGYLQDAQAVQYERVAEDTKQAMYGNGNSVNPILKIKGRHYLYGERTMQRAESKLTAVHNMVMVNWVVTGMATVARRFVFDPNDAELLTQLKHAFTEFLDKIVNGRGIEQYNLVMDDRNNTAETRNNREVIVDLELIPTDVAERIYINAIVRESGATLNTLS